MLQTLVSVKRKVSISLCCLSVQFSLDLFKTKLKTINTELCIAPKFLQFLFLTYWFRKYYWISHWLKKWQHTFSYFSFSLAAFCSYGCLSLADCSDHISPNFFAVSPMDKPGCSLLIFGRCSEQNRKKADLKGKNRVVITWMKKGGEANSVGFKRHLRRPFRSVGIFFLSLLVTFRRDIIFHLPVVASFVTFCHVFEFGLFLGRHGL